MLAYKLITIRSLPVVTQLVTTQLNGVCAGRRELLVGLRP